MNKCYQFLIGIEVHLMCFDLFLFDIILNREKNCVTQIEFQNKMSSKMLNFRFIEFAV